MQSGESSRALRVAVLFLAALVVGAVWGRGNGVVAAQRNDPILPLSSSQQQPKTGGLPSDNDNTGFPDDMDVPARARMNENRVNALNEARHKRLEDDASKLQALSSELKTDVDKSNKDELSLEVMRKAAEIEKLAHDVQNRMKN